MDPGNNVREKKIGVSTFLPLIFAQIMQHSFVLFFYFINLT